MARRRSFRSDAQRRKMSWGVGPEGTLSISASTSTVFATGAQIAIADMTLTRTRGELLLFLQTASAALSGFQYAFGLCLVSQNAAGIGATAIPEPLTDLGWDGWFFHHQGALKSPATTIVSDLGAQVVRIPVDSKAQRKVRETDVVVAVLETVETVSSIMHAELRSRILFRLP